jgi:hypothetical protein
LGSRPDSTGNSNNGNTMSESSNQNVPAANEVTEPIDDLPF